MGLGVKRAREKAGLSAAKLEEKTRELGYPITRGTIAKIEGGHRDGKFDVNEVVILAAALTVTPLDLVFPTTPAPVEYIPGLVTSVGDALEWFSDSRALKLAQERVRLLSSYDHGYEATVTKWAEIERTDDLPRWDSWNIESMISALISVAEKLQENWETLREVGLAEGDDPRASDYLPAIEDMRARQVALARRTQDDA